MTQRHTLSTTSCTTENWLQIDLCQGKQRISLSTKVRRSRTLDTALVEYTTNNYWQLFSYTPSWQGTQTAVYWQTWLTVEMGYRKKSINERKQNEIKYVPTVELAGIIWSWPWMLLLHLDLNWWLREIEEYYDKLYAGWYLALKAHRIKLLLIRQFVCLQCTRSFMPTCLASPPPPQVNSLSSVKTWLKPCSLCLKSLAMQIAAEVKSPQIIILHSDSVTSWLVNTSSWF